MAIAFNTTEVPSSVRGSAGPSEYAAIVKDLADHKGSKAVTATVPTDEVPGLLRTIRRDTDLLGVAATIRARQVKSKDGKTVTLTLWAVDKITQNRQPSA
jgi:hypothetical protein